MRLTIQDPGVREAIEFWASPGGGLLCKREVTEMKQDPPEIVTETVSSYGGRYFVSETLSQKALQRIAEALGGTVKG